MKILEFCGHSDDTFGEYCSTGIDYDNCGTGEPIMFRVSADDTALLVVGRYNTFGPRPGLGCWMIGTCLEKEGATFPLWPMRFINAHEYSHALVIEAPDNVVVELVVGI